MGLTVWYAGYGSNLCQQRLDAYLGGGRPPGSRRTHPGARDPRPPRDVATATLPGRLAFRGRFAGWGDGGGAAFWEGPDGPARTWCRAYRLTVAQMTDLALQENGLDPRELEAGELRVLDRQIGQHASGGGPTRCGLMERSRPYADLVRVTAATEGGTLLPVVTLTGPAGHPAPPTPPPVAYVRVILAGLGQDVGLDDHRADSYLRAAGVPARTLQQARAARAT